MAEFYNLKIRVYVKTCERSFMKVVLPGTAIIILMLLCSYF